jgi:hypothetical protein
MMRREFITLLGGGGGMAAHGGGPAIGQAADHRVSERADAFHRGPMGRRF